MPLTDARNLLSLKDKIAKLREASAVFDGTAAAHQLLVNGA
jgi:hypothetical protein